MSNQTTPDRVVEILFPGSGVQQRGRSRSVRRRVSSGVPFTDPMIVLADVNNPSGTTISNISANENGRGVEQMTRENPGWYKRTQGELLGFGIRVGALMRLPPPSSPISPQRGYSVAGSSVG